MVAFCFVPVGSPPSSGRGPADYSSRQKQQAKLARQAVDRIDWGEIGNMLPDPEAGVEFQTALAEKKSK